jgi:hypothetical protein
VAAQHLEDDVPGAHPLRQLANELHTPDLRHLEVERLAHDRERHLDPARAEREHAERARGGRVAVGADQRLARLAEALHVDRVADAVAGAAVPDAEALAGAPQELVIVGVLVILLDQVVVDILRRELGSGALQADGLELEHDQRPGRVLGEGLIDPERDLASGGRLTLDQVTGSASVSRSAPSLPKAAFPRLSSLRSHSGCQ